MRTIKGEELAALRWYGRTYRDGEQIYFNWTDSGFELAFTGRLLMAGLHVCPYMLQEPYIDAVTQASMMREVPDWPWIAVFLDGQEEPYRMLPVNAQEQEVLLFASAKIEHHRIRVVKLSEGAFYKIALRTLTTDGEAAAPETACGGTIEFIGDSITCGFGNGVNDAQRRFYAADENGWKTYAAITARNLGLDASIIAVSGITLLSGVKNMPYSFGMKDIYPYTDRLLEERLGKTEDFERWDFAAHPRDIVVLNLGTNDATAIAKSGDPAMEAAFRCEYAAFLAQLRTLYGPETRLVCTLGGIDHYLYDTIRDAVADYKKASGDERVWSFKFGKMIPGTEDVGACMHPTVALHEKMAGELTAFLRTLV